MERTVTLLIATTFVLVGAALIFFFVAQQRETIQNNFCAPTPQCNGKANGETSCVPGGLDRCVLKDGCMEIQHTSCACSDSTGVAQCG